MTTQPKKELFNRIESEINSYISEEVEIAEDVQFSQYETIKRIYKFRNRDLGAGKINADLSYNYYFDIIEPRVNSEAKNLRFDTKHILFFSNSPVEDFPAVFIANATLQDFMKENGEDDKLKEAVDEFVMNGNIGFKKVDGTYEIVDPTNTIITNQLAKDVTETNIIERHEMTASEIKSYDVWDQDVAGQVIEELGDKFFNATTETTPTQSTTNSYEIFEYTGEVSEREFNALDDRVSEEGDPDKYFLAKIIIAGLNKSGKGDKYVLFIEKLKGDMTDHYIYAHRGKYNGRFWRVGMYELLFDYQVRANEIGNQLARGLEWASNVIFRTSDSSILQNIRADLENGDVIVAKDLEQVDVRMRNMDQLIADWNRLNEDADRLTNSFEIVRGESMPSGTPFRLGALIDQNAGMFFVLLRQKLTLPFKRVFSEWVLPDLMKDMKGEEIFSLTGNNEMLDRVRVMMAEQWYMDNLVKIGPHTREQAEAIKAEKVDELRRIDPVIENEEDIWDGALERISITITGENSDLADQITDLMTLIELEEDPERRSFMLDQIYALRNIPIPPKTQEPPEEQIVREAGTANFPESSQIGGGQGRSPAPNQ